MNRKNTILLAVLVNAGLLVVLFVTALTSQEEIAIAPTHEVAGSPAALNQSPAPPLFGDEIDLTLREKPAAPPAATSLPQVLPEPVASAKTPEQPVHSLPPLVPEAAPVAAAPAPAPVAVAPAAHDATTVVVKKGDTLEKIAKALHTTVDELIKMNQLPSSFLRVGQKLKVPPAKAKPTQVVKSAAPEKKAMEGAPDYYTMKVGDNVWSIAMKHHMRVDELLKLNNLNEEKARKLKPGDRLRIR